MNKLGKPDGKYLPRRLRDLTRALETNLQGYLDDELTGPQAIAGVQEVKMAVQKEIARDYMHRRVARHQEKNDG